LDRAQKAAAIAEIAEDLRGAEAVFAVDYRGISVPQAAEVRSRLREADARFRIVKNTLTELAADEVGAEALKALLQGPTALTFVRGDAAVAAKAIASFNRETELLSFKGGTLGGEALDVPQLQALARLPARDVLYGQLVGVVASPISGVVRTLNALVSGLAVALGQVQAKKESGELPADPDAPAPAAEAAPAAGDAPAPKAGADETPAAEASADEPPLPETPDQDAEAPQRATEPDAPAEGATEQTDTDTEEQADASA
jgi:large subunit ribosomal protein L10